MQLPGASDASTWANSRLRPADSAGGGFNAATMSADAHASGDGASCQAGAAALWDNRGRAGLLSSGATGSTTGLQASLPAPRGVPAVEPAHTGGGRLGDGPSRQRTDAQRQAGEAGGPLAMLSDAELAGYCWEYQPPALNADGAPGHLLSLVGHYQAAELTLAHDRSMPSITRESGFFVHDLTVLNTFSAWCQVFRPR